MAESKSEQEPVAVPVVLELVEAEAAAAQMAQVAQAVRVVRVAEMAASKPLAPAGVKVLRRTALCTSGKARSGRCLPMDIQPAGHSAGIHFLRILPFQILPQFEKSNRKRQPNNFRVRPPPPFRSK